MRRLDISPRIVYAYLMTTVESLQEGNVRILTKGASSTSIVSGNMQATDSVQMSFDADSLPHLMQSLTNLYADPYLAILREYSMNARDSHVAANQSDPVLITLPSRLDPVFVVQDSGTGMSKDEILDIYSKYGRSTKREDMTQVGAFGLGSKCALSLVDQFSIISIKDGERTVAIVTKTANGGGEVKVISCEQTDEHNGVRVVIPIPNYERFTRNSQQFFMSWEPGTVLVDGAAPASLYDDKDFVHYGDFRLAAMRDGYRSVFLVIGGLSYEVADPQYLPTIGRDMAPHRVYIDIPIGAVDFTPARDTLRYTSRTREIIREKVLELGGLYTTIVQQDIDAQETRSDAVETRLKWLARGHDDPHDYTWKGESIPSIVYSHLVPSNDPECDELVPGNMDRHVLGGRDVRHFTVSLSKSISITEGNSKNRCIVITGEHELSSARLRAVLRDFVFDGGYAARSLSYSNTQRTIYVLKTDAALSEWLTDSDRFQVVSMEDVVAHSVEIRRTRRREAAEGRATGGATTSREADITYTVGRVTDRGIYLESEMKAGDIPLDAYYLDRDAANILTSTYTRRRGNKRDATTIADLKSGDHIVNLTRAGTEATLFSRMSKARGSEVTLTSISQKMCQDENEIRKNGATELDAYLAQTGARRHGGIAHIILEMMETYPSIRKHFPDFIPALSLYAMRTTKRHAFRRVTANHTNGAIQAGMSICDMYHKRYPLLAALDIYGGLGIEYLTKEAARYVKLINKEARDTVVSTEQEG